MVGTFVMSLLFLRWDSFYPTLSLCFRWNENGENVRLLSDNTVLDSKKNNRGGDQRNGCVCQGLLWRLHAHRHTERSGSIARSRRRNKQNNQLLLQSSKHPNVQTANSKQQVGTQASLVTELSCKHTRLMKKREQYIGQVCFVLKS